MHIAHKWGWPGGRAAGKKSIDAKAVVSEVAHSDITHPDVFHHIAPAALGTHAHAAARAIEQTIVNVHIADAAGGLAANGTAGVAHIDERQTATTEIIGATV